MHEFKVEGMSCSGCVRSITNAIKLLDPQSEVSVDLKENSVKVNSEKAESEIEAVIENAGYTVQ
jgi:copper chaperone